MNGYAMCFLPACTMDSSATALYLDSMLLYMLVLSHVIIIKGLVIREESRWSCFALLMS